MRIFLAALAIGLCADAAMAQGRVWVKPYVTDDGTFVRGHYRTAPDNSVYNNWSTVGNVNPYTGQPGTLQPGRTYVTQNGAGRVYYTAPHTYTYQPPQQQQYQPPRTQYVPVPVYVPQYQPQQGGIVVRH